MSLNLLRINMPNKESTVVQVADEMLLQEVLRHICEKRLLDPRDYCFTNPHSKKKEEVDLTLQYRQHDDLKEVDLCRVKKKSFILPATSKNTTMRTITPPSDKSSLLVPKANEEIEEPKKARGRLRSISLTFRGNPKQRETVLPQKSEAESGDSLAIEHNTEALTTLKITTDFLSGSNLSQLADFMSSKVMPISPENSAPSILEGNEEEDDTSSVYSASSINSAEDVAREKIVRSKNMDHTKTMTLQKKKLRPRASSVISRSDNENLEEVVVRVSLPNGNVTALKVQPTATMEAILRTICEKKALSFEDHTIQLPDRDDPIDLDRPLGYYKVDPLVVLVVPSKEKSYSTMCVSEGDRDVMILSFVSGKLEVVAGTEEKLIEKMTDEQETDRRFVDIFLLTYRNFMTPEDFFDSLIYRFNSEPPEGATEEELTYYHKCIDIVREKVIGVITRWISNYWDDFQRSQSLKSDLEDFINQVEKFSYFSEQLKELKKAHISQQQPEIGLQAEDEKIISESIFVNLKARHIAEQICCLNYNLFQSVGPIEFLNQLWRPGAQQCKNLIALIERFNRESSWVATEICEATDFNKRVQTLKKFLEVLKELYDLNNYFSVFSILAGLNAIPVQRLKKTWASLPSSTRKTYDEIEKISDPSKNMKVYREHIDKAKPPSLPFLPIFLKDLIFVNDGNTSRFNNNLVNFEKLRLLADKIQEFVALSAIPFPFEKNKEIQSYLKHARTESIEKLAEKTQPEPLD